MKLKEAFKFMFHLFCATTTCIIIFIALTSYDSLSLLRIPAVAFAGALPVLIFVHGEKASRAEIIVRKVLHFILTAGIVGGFVIWFGWVDGANAVLVGAFFLAVYVGVYVVSEVRAKRFTDRLNERLNAFHNGENEGWRDGG
jgi:hypothetical protein